MSTNNNDLPKEGELWIYDDHQLEFVIHVDDRYVKYFFTHGHGSGMGTSLFDETHPLMIEGRYKRISR